MGLAHSPRIATDGLVLCLDAANQKSYPGSSIIWTDISGNGNNGTLTNGTELVKQNSIALDGSGDFLTLTNLSATYLSNDFCVESWVYVTTQSNQMFFNTVPHNSFGISLNRGGSGQTALYIGNGSGWQTLDFRSSGTLVANQWHHIAVTRNSNVITIWHNGVNQGSTSAFMPTGFSTSAYIGTYNNGAGEFINGKIYGYRIVSGSPVYTANFTPPARVSNISGTQMIIAQDGGFVNSAQTSVVATPSGNTFVNDQSYMKFDGVDDYTNFGNIINFSDTDAFSILGWVKKSSSYYTNVSNILSKQSISSPYTGYQFGFNLYGDTVGKIGFGAIGSYPANSLGVNSISTFNNENWIHVAGTYNGNGLNSGLKIYANSVLQEVTGIPGYSGTCSVSFSNNTNLQVGARSGAIQLFGGNISKIQMYNKELSAQEVQQNFNALRGRYGL
jgi:hypothetical protein